MIAVTLTIDAGVASSARITGPLNAPLVFVTGILTLTFVAPRGDRAPLRDHLVEIVGEDLERDRAVGNRREQLRGERLVVGRCRPCASASDWW